MEAPVFLFFCLSVGYLLYWTTVNDKRDPNGGRDGWFAIKPSEAKAPPPLSDPRPVRPKGHERHLK